VAVAPPAPLSLASKAPWWLLGTFVVSTLLALTWAALFTLGLINTQYGNYPVENVTFSAVVALAAVAMLGLQVTALIGLYMRRHWGRAVATIASGFWVFTVVGIPFAILAWWVMHRRWDPGVESTFNKDHPSAPPYVVGLCAVGAALVLVWTWFLYFHLVNLLTQLVPSQQASGWYWIVSLAFFFSIPLWVVQGLAVVGLLRKHDWGAVLALVTCVLWVLSGIGLPFGVAGLVLLWRWQHPALRTTLASGAPA
jgi:hypothetical protein